jgi:hypothetical protein
MVHKNFSAFLQYDFFTSVEYHKPEVEANNSLALLNSDSCVKSGVKQVPVIALQAAVFGGAAGHPYLRDCMRWYEENSFLLSGYNKDFIAPDVFALTAQKYGFRYKDGKQNLARNMLLLPSCFIAADPSKYTKKAYATHYIAHSWHDRSLTEKIKSTKMYRLLSRNSILRWLIKQSDSL